MILLASEFKSFYKTVGGNEGNKCHYPTRLDTYGKGCSHNCDYCYARSLLEFRGLWHPEDPAVADIVKVRKKVQSLDKDDVMRLGGMTDCFQPIEKIYRTTYSTIKELNEAGVGYLIVTKSPMVADKEYLEVMDKDLAHIQITVTTTDDDFYQKLGFEKAPYPSERIKAIKKLQKAGFDVSIRLSPYIDGFIDFDKLKGIDNAVLEFLRVNHWIKKWFDIDYSEYTLKQGGYFHLPLEKKIELANKIKQYFKSITVCEDEDEAYEWFKENFNPNKEDCCNLRK